MCTGIGHNGIHDGSEYDMAIVILKRQKSDAEDCIDHQAMFCWLDRLVACMDSRPYFKNSVFVSLQMECSKVDVVRLMESQSAMSSAASIARPPQSFSTLHSKQIRIDRNKVAVSVSRLDGSTRKDTAKILSLNQCAFAGGNKCILIERLLYEIAYKTGLANKYGA